MASALNTAPGSLSGVLAEAARAVRAVGQGRSLSLSAPEEDQHGQHVSRAALLDITHCTLRAYGRLQAVVRLLSRHVPADALIESLLWCALATLDSGRYAPYTVVDQAVRACSLVRGAHARGYVNGILRRYLRERAAVDVQLATDEEAVHRHPQWWIDAVRRALPSCWQTVLHAGNQRPPMCLRVNARRNSTEAYLVRLHEAGIDARIVGPAAVLLSRPMPVDALPGFREGDVSVQDAGAQRAAAYLDLQRGQRVLDACAAPGGKSAHMLEAADVALTALDADESRCELVSATLGRLGLGAERVAAADCRTLDAWWDGLPFERVLADVPCSSSGVVRRVPDAKWLRRAGDLPAYARRQGEILDALWQVLAAGGKLLYVTCSVFAEENEDVVDSFLQRTPGAQRLVLPQGAAARLEPTDEHDAFFFALLSRPH